MRISQLFLVLVFIQALHSIEEYVGELWNNFPPATYLCSLISDDLRFGFLVINIGLFVLGILAWYFIVKPNTIGSGVVLAFWIIIEIANGIVHPVWSIMQKSYTPGVITAPLLFMTAIMLVRVLYKKH